MLAPAADGWGGGQVVTARQGGGEVGQRVRREPPRDVAAGGSGRGCWLRPLCRGGGQVVTARQGGGAGGEEGAADESDWQRRKGVVIEGL